MKLFHKASNLQIERLFERKATIADLKKEFEQPKWCAYDGALDGKFGCWSLMDIYGLRKKISPKFCSNCDCFIPKIK